MRYRAKRSLHYVDVDGQERFVTEGDFVTKASETKMDELLADGFVVAVRPQKTEDGD